MRRVSAFVAALLAGTSLAAPSVWGQQNATSARANGITLNTNGSRLGIGAQDVTADRAKVLKLKEARGVEVTMVGDNTPASRAGLRPGDAIVEFNAKPVAGLQELLRMLGGTPAGSEVKLGVWRNGHLTTIAAVTERQTYLETPAGTIDFGGVTVTIPPIPPMPPLPNVSIDIPTIVAMVHCTSLGVDEETLQPDGQLADFFGVREGVLVKAVSHDSPAEKAGMKAGDVIVKVGDSKVASTRDVNVALREARPDRSLTVMVMRNRKETSLNVNLEDPRNMRR
ncbi:MAG TPA: PDZ domain-containing protein [Verrucomicrobiae bacterium]|nr:PDZ domain-containing protein [Verrucomicrobiae bacterium]